MWPHLTLAPLLLLLPLLGKRINKRALAISPELRSTTTEGKTRKRRREKGLHGGSGPSRRRGRIRGEKKPHIGTQSSHLKSTDRGCIEANKRGSKCDTVHSERCLAAAAAVQGSIKERIAVGVVLTLPGINVVAPL